MGMGHSFAFFFYFLQKNFNFLMFVFSFFNFLIQAAFLSLLVMTALVSHFAGANPKKTLQIEDTIHLNILHGHLFLQFGLYFSLLFAPCRVRRIHKIPQPVQYPIFVSLFFGMLGALLDQTVREVQLHVLQVFYEVFFYLDVGA